MHFIALLMALPIIAMFYLFYKACETMFDSIVLIYHLLHKDEDSKNTPE